MFQELDNDTKNEAWKTIFSKKEEMLKHFEKRGYGPDSPVSVDLWFFQGQDVKHLLFKVLSICQQKTKSLESQYSNVTVDVFVTELLHSINILHLEIMERQMNKDYLLDGQVTLHKAEKKLQDETLENHENAVVIAFVKNKQFMSDIYRFYSIRFKAATVHQSYQLIHSEDSDRTSLLALDPLDEKIFFSIEGKRLDKGNEETFKEIAQLELPLVELYHSIGPRHYGIPTIPPTYLILRYADQSLDSPYPEENQFELRFDLRQEKDRRIQVIQQLVCDNNQTLKNLEQQINDRMDLMKQLLEPFQPEKSEQTLKPINYVKSRGLGDPKDFPPIPKKQDDPDKPKDRDNCCKIY